MDDETKIREIEKELDTYYKTSDFVKHYINNRQQAIFDLLRVYEDINTILPIAGTVQKKLGLINSQDVIFSQTHDLQDTLNTAIQWIYADFCETDTFMSYTLSESNYLISFIFLHNYAAPYSVIVDGYTSYSRHVNTGRVEGKKVIFDATAEQRVSFITDVGERYSKHDDTLENAVEQIIHSSDFQKGIAELASTIHITNEKLCYDAPDSVEETQRFLGEAQWNETSDVPQDWEFDHFTLIEYKKCWIELFVLCSIHIIARLKSNLPGFAPESGVLVYKKDSLINHLYKKTQITKECINAILDILTYDPLLKNTDIMYQPLISLGDEIIVTPSLITKSCPERNLLAIIQKKSDSKYSTVVNSLEGVMCAELTASLPKNALYVCGVRLGKNYPDVDYAIYDQKCNCLLICEMKWLIAADSTKEVLERQKDIDHGCEQIEKIMGYAMQNPISFVERLFHTDISERPDLFCCVIAKHDIRSLNNHVPVISLKCISNMLKSIPLPEVFFRIRNKEYYKPLPKHSKMGHRIIHYAGYEIWVPALEIENEYMLAEDMSDIL